ncbi:MAG: ABC transporter substrate-binding protein [Streptosporangiales bacterium]
MSTTDNEGIGRRELLAGMGAMGLGVGLTACGGSTDAGANANAGGTTHVTLVLDVTPYGKHSPFYVAKKKGMWEKRGLKVSIQSGKGSADAFNKVASGSGQFAFADISTVILGMANKSIGSKMVCMYHYKNLMAEIGLASAGIEKPQDFVGKKLQTTPGNGALLLLPALGEINHFDAKKVKTPYGEFSSIVPNLMGGNVDGALTYFTTYPALEAAAQKAGGKKTSYVLYADYGLDIYNNGIIVTDDYLKNSPNQVKAFTAGFVEAVRYTVAHPDEAAQIFGEMVPGISPDVVKAQQQIAINHLHVPEVEKHGFGPMSEAKMTKTLKLINKYFKLKKPVKDIGSLYTNDYVPTGKVPRFRYKKPKEPSI